MARRPTLQPGDGYAVPLFGTPEPAAQSLFATGLTEPSQATATYSSACVRCRYSRPGATTDHRGHACPACGGADCAGDCGAVALSLPVDSAIADSAGSVPID